MKGLGLYIIEKLSKIYAQQDLRPSFSHFLHKCLFCLFRSILPCLSSHVLNANYVNKVFILLLLIGINYCIHCTVLMYLYVYFLTVLAMAGLNYYKPKFNWDVIDKLSELDHFKAECEVLLNGPLNHHLIGRQA